MKKILRISLVMIMASAVMNFTSSIREALEPVTWFVATYGLLFGGILGIMTYIDRRLSNSFKDREDV